MKIGIGGPAVFILFLGAAARGATLQILNVSDDSPAGAADFAGVPEGAGDVLAGQYLKLSYATATTTGLQVLTKNTGWIGPAAAPRGGLLSQSSPARTAPLYWKAFAAPQAGGPAFSSADPTWRPVTDQGDPGFPSASAAVPLNAQGQVYIYLAAAVPFGTVHGAYGTGFTVRVADPTLDPPPAAPTALRIP